MALTGDDVLHVEEDKLKAVMKECGVGYPRIKSVPSDKYPCHLYPVLRDGSISDEGFHIKSDSYNELPYRSNRYKTLFVFGSVGIQDVLQLIYLDEHGNDYFMISGSSTYTSLKASIVFAILKKLGVAPTIALDSQGVEYNRAFISTAQGLEELDGFTAHILDENSPYEPYPPDPNVPGNPEW